MRNSLEHLPKHKQQELNAIRDAILENIPEVRMVILFGSFARGDWVEDTHIEDNATHVYESDFDILVLTRTQKDADSFVFQDAVNTAINVKGIGTPTSIIYHTLDHVQQMIIEGQYFFCDIQKEGIVLYNKAGENSLGKVNPIPPAERKIIAQQHFDQWLEKAKRFYEFFKHALEKDWNKEAAFNLHQATESLYSTVTLVFLNYRFRLHNIEILTHKVISYDQRFTAAFPLETPQQQENFELLKRAYVDARYKEDYAITKEQLEYLGQRVKVLQELTERICKEKIESFV